MKNFSIALLLIFSTFASVFAQTKTDCPITVTVLHVNDVYQFVPVEGGKRGGLARLLTLKKQITAENPNTIFTLGGDTLSPSVETRTYQGAQMIDAWNAAGLDLAVLGNHEFDVKTPELLERIKESRFQWLGANVVDTRSNQLLPGTLPFVIKDFGGVKVGFLGLLLPETKETSSMEAFLTVKNFCDTAKELVPQMRAAGASAVVGLTHLYMSQDKELAKCADFDLILGGHEHTLLQSSSNGTPIFKMTADAREMGRFNLNFNGSTKRLESIDWEVIPVTDAIPDAPEFAAVVDKYKDLLQRLAEPVGMTGVELDALSYSSRNNETNVGNFIADTYRQATGADIGFVNGGSIRADLTYNPGVLTKRDVLSILPFNNAVVKIEITGKILRRVLEHGVARSGGEDNEPGRFPQVSGLSFTFDAGKPSGARVTEIKVGGKPLEENKTYTLATSDFLVRGGDGYEMFADARVLVASDKAPKDSELLEKAILSAPNRTIAPKLENRVVKITSGARREDCP